MKVFRLSSDVRPLINTCNSTRSEVSLDGPSTSSQSLNHDRSAELRCRGTVSVEQSSGCSTETGDDT